MACLIDAAVVSSSSTRLLLGVVSTVAALHCIAIDLLVGDKQHAD